MNIKIETYSSYEICERQVEYMIENGYKVIGFSHHLDDGLNSTTFTIMYQEVK